jgi:hypothetical protein
MIQLPSRIFFSGVPGSRWSGVAQLIETIPGFNITDRNPERSFEFNAESKVYSKHYGAYFGTGMEFDLSLESSNIDQAHATLDGCRMIKAHEWAYHFNEIKERYPNDWILLIYRPDFQSFAWWQGAGGFDISYPMYHAFGDHIDMMSKISKMNQEILKFAHQENVNWHQLTPKWLEDNFGVALEVPEKFSDILITVIKP